MILLLRSFPSFVRALAFVLLAVLAPPIACVGFFAVPEIIVLDNSVVNRADLASWVRLPAGPVRFTSIARAGFAEVYASDETGQIWRCTISSRFDRACWVTSPENPPEAQACLIEEQPDAAEALIQGGFQADEVVDWKRATYCDAGPGGKALISEYVYVLDESGAMWQWGFDRAGMVKQPMYRDLKLGLGAASAFGILGAVGLVLIALYQVGRGSSRQSGA